LLSFQAQYFARKFVGVEAMIALCLAALLGALAGPFLAAAFASPVLILTAPLFASLAALLAGCGLAMASARVGAQAETSRSATDSVHAVYGERPGSTPIPNEKNQSFDATDQTVDEMVAALRNILSYAERAPETAQIHRDQDGPKPSSKAV
jgi:hypothetical protein